MLVKFCCCCDLRYGWIAYAVILLIFRITIPLSLTIVLPLEISIPLVFWNLPVAGFTIMALYGVIQKKGILMYPSIVLTIMEIVLTFVIGIVLSCVTSPFAVFLIFFTALLTYYAITLYSLHAIFKYIDDSRSLSDLV